MFRFYGLNRHHPCGTACDALAMLSHITIAAILQTLVVVCANWISEKIKVQFPHML